MIIWYIYIYCKTTVIHTYNMQMSFILPNTIQLHVSIFCNLSIYIPYSILISLDGTDTVVLSKKQNILHAVLCYQVIFCTMRRNFKQTICTFPTLILNLYVLQELFPFIVGKKCQLTCTMQLLSFVFAIKLYSNWGCCDRMVVGFIITYAISAYQH